MKKTVLEYLELGPLRRCASKPAIIDGDRAVTFGEMAALAKAGARLIQTRAPDSQNEPVAVFLPKSSEAMVANLAALYSGNFYAPLDVKSPPERLKMVVENLKPA